MGFRVPLTSATSVDTGDTAGVRIYGNAKNPGAGVVQWYVGNASASGELDSSQTGSGGQYFSLALANGPVLQLNREPVPAGGYQRVARLTGYDAVHMDPIVSALTPSAGWARTAGGYGDGNVFLNELPRVWVEPDGTVHCVGAWTNTGAVIVAVYEPWFVLPAGYAPPDDAVRTVAVIDVTTSTTPSLQRCDVGKDGRCALAITANIGAGRVWAFDWTWRLT